MSNSKNVGLTETVLAISTFCSSSVQASRTICQASSNPHSLSLISLQSRFALPSVAFALLSGSDCPDIRRWVKLVSRKYPWLLTFSKLNVDAYKRTCGYTKK